MPNLSGIRKSYTSPADAHCAKNITDKQWQRFHREIKLLHNAGCTKQAILDALAKDESAIEDKFHPTVNQLVRQMGIWRLRDDQRHNRKQGWRSLGPHEPSHPRGYGLGVTQTAPSTAATPLPYLPPPPIPFSAPQLPNYLFPDPATSVHLPTLSDVSRSCSRQLPGPVLAPNAPSVPQAYADEEGPMTFTQSARPSLHTTEESSRLFKVHRKRRSADSAMDELESSIDAMTIDTRSSWHFSKVTGMPSQKGSSNPPNHGSRQGEPKKHHESNSPLEVLNFARKSAAFYEVGRVFGHLLINRSNGTDLKFEGRMAQANGFHSRDFIVTRRSEDSFDAVPFHTHRTADAHHGKRRLLDENQEQLAVIHLEDEKPITLHENPITALEPIAVRPVQATRSVCQPSVIDFSKVIRFHYSGLVIDLGMVTERSMTHFEEYAKIHTRSEGTPHANESELGENRAFWDRWLPLGVVDRSGFEIADETSSKARRLMASQTTNSFLPIMETSQNSDTLLPIMEGETTSYWLNEALDDFDGRAPVPAPRAAPLLEPYAPYSHPPPPTAYMTHSYPPPAKSYPAYSFHPPPLPFWHEDMPYHIPGSEFV